MAFLRQTAVDCEGGGQSYLAASLWRRARADNGGFWALRRSTVPSGVARLAGGALRRERLGREGNAPVDCEFVDLSAGLDASDGIRRSGSAQSIACVVSACPPACGADSRRGAGCGGAVVRAHRRAECFPHATGRAVRGARSGFAGQLEFQMAILGWRGTVSPVDLHLLETDDAASCDVDI